MKPLDYKKIMRDLLDRRESGEIDPTYEASEWSQCNVSIGLATKCKNTCSNLAYHSMQYTTDPIDPHEDYKHPIRMSLKCPDCGKVEQLRLIRWDNNGGYYERVLKGE